MASGSGLAELIPPPPPPIISVSISSSTHTQRASSDIEGCLIGLDALLRRLELDHMSQSWTAVNVPQQLLHRLVLSLDLAFDLEWRVSYGTEVC